MIITYRKFVTEAVTRELRLPESADQSALGLELATVDGITYVFLPDGIDLPADQPAEIAASIQRVELNATQREKIKAASPHCWLIAQRVIEKIRARYSVDDEMYFARIGVGASTGLYGPSDAEMHEMTVFGEFVESARQWGRDQRAMIGL